jgi:hypothetical protein
MDTFQSKLDSLLAIKGLLEVYIDEIVGQEGVLEQSGWSQPPTIVVPRGDGRGVRRISDFRALNRIKKPNNWKPNANNSRLIYSGFRAKMPR